MEFLKDSNWVWVKEWRAEEKESPQVVLFRKKVYIEKEVVKACIRISADSRYKLYVNGEFVEFGPSKGDKEIWFYDELDISKVLKKGENVIAVKVLRYPEEASKGSHSVFATAIPGLYVVGEIVDSKREVYDISADVTWKYFVEKNVRVLQEEERFAPLCIHEETCGSIETFGWLDFTFNDSTWENVKPYSRVEVPGSISPGNLNPRNIPFMYRNPRTFDNIFDIKKSDNSESQWNSFLQDNSVIVIKANSEEIVEIDTGEEMTGFVKLALASGKGAKVEILYSEAYVLDERMGPAQVPVKNNRLDKVNGHLEGYKDIYYVGGFGTEENPEIFDPFWFRTYRFIQLRITTKEVPLVLINFDYEETGYPLDVVTWVKTSDESHKDIWDISERTLRRCMHETYEDCPFYEQLQYAMDTRTQILYTYAVSADDRLARKAMDDFRRSQRQDGLLNCCYPNSNPNVIPGFSIYYILMIHDHMMYFGDKDLVKKHSPVIEQILGFFDRNLSDNGYVDKIGGLLLESPFWSFIDWAEQWNPTTGMPPAGIKGALTMESLLYIMGLLHASELAKFIGRDDQANEYLKRAESVKKAIREHCIGENGLVQDGPNIDEYSQQCQVFAILAEVVDFDLGKKNLLETITNKNYTQCTVAMRFYLFRALEKVGLYEYTDEYWQPWRKMVSNNCSTCVESEAYARSECHGWGALALYELPSVVLGVRPVEIGYKKVKIEPVTGYLTHAKGVVKTPLGEIKVSWTMDKGILNLNYEVPEGIEII